MGGSSQQQPTNQTITQTSIPQEFRPYYTDNFGAAQAVVSRPYEAYQGPRLSDFSSDTKYAFDLGRSNVGSYMPFMEAGTNAINGAIGKLSGVTGAYDKVNAPSVQYFQSGNARDVAAKQWGQDKVNQYLSPYVSSVLDNLQRKSNDAFLQDQANIGTVAANSGAFGGGRQGVMTAMAQKAANQRLLDLQTEGMNNAWNQALNAFGSDRNASLQADISNQSADLTTNKMNLDAKLGVQNLDTTNQMNAQLANQSAGLQGQQLAMSAASAMGGLGGQLAGLGQMYSNLGWNDVNMLRNQGLAQEQLNQASMDIGYQDFVNQRDYDRNNVTWMSGILNGLPNTSTTSSASYQSINPYSQMLGAGIGAAGLYSNMSQP